MTGYLTQTIIAGVDFCKFTPKILDQSSVFAHKALQAEQKIGTMLPCNVIVHQLEYGAIDISAVDPMASMQAIENPSLGTIAVEVQEKLKRVIQSLNG